MIHYVKAGLVAVVAIIIVAQLPLIGPIVKNALK
jgi:hypothetical protein